MCEDKYTVVDGSKLESSNSCCKAWKDKYTKLEEKRIALRQAVKLLEQQIKNFQAENLILKKGFEEQKARASSIEREGKDKESAIRVSLETEILDLKSQISLLRQNDIDAVNVHGEVEHLNAIVAEGKKEISQLKVLLETEKRRTDAERKNAEARKEEAAQALKTVKNERSKTTDLRKAHKTEMDKVSECKQQLGMLKKEYEETKLKLASETSKLIGVKKDLEVEKQRTSKERERATSEMSKAQASKIQAEASKKQVEEEKSRAENLFQQLERKTCKIEELQKQLKELQTLKFFIESCCGQHDKKTDSKAVEKNDKPWLEMIQRNAKEFKLVFEFLKEKDSKTNLKEKPVKSSELKKHLEIYGRKGMDEQCRADKLSLELEEKKRKVEELQKKLREFKSSRKLVDASAVSLEHAMSSERAEMKLLKKKLKFEKTRLKHARQVANMEKTHRSIIQQELGRFKLEFVQLSNHLDNLHKFSSTGAKDNDDLEKTMNAGSLQSLYSKKNLCAIEPFQTWTPDTFRRTTPQHGAPLLPLSGGNHVSSLSGIESRLESLPGDSNRKMLQTCAVNSSTASFSDGQLVGSQEKAGLCLTAAKLVGENLNMQPRISNLSGEVSKIKSNENLAMMAENSVRSPIKNHVGRANEKQQKRKRTIETVESIEHLYHESKKMHSQIEEKLSLLHVLNSPTEKLLEKSGHVISNVLQDSSADKKVRKKRKTLCQKKIKVQHLLDNEMKLNQVVTEVCVPKSIGRQSSQPVSKLTDSCQPCPEELNNSVIELQILGTFGSIADGDYMKLLDLDSAADEDCYRKAMERPLSPSLPDIDIPDVEISALIDFEPLVDELHKELPNEGQPQLHSYDVMDVEIKSNCTQSCNSGLLGDIHSSKCQLDPCLMQESRGSDFGDIVQAEKKCLDQVGIIVGMPGINDPLSGCEGVGTPEIKSGTQDSSIPDFCVLFSNTKDCHSISRIFSATRACINRISLTSQKEWMVQEILSSLKMEMEHKLLPKEKTCVFFSLLLLNFTVVAVHKYGNRLNCNTCLDSFSGHICEAMLDVEIRSLFSELLCLDELLALIEDFILDGRVLSCTDVSIETSAEGVLNVNIPIDGVNRTLALVPASTNYLIAGSSILASISKAVHCIGLLWEVSYNILRTCRYETSLVLTILHIFAHIGGDQFFSLEGYSTLMAVLKSIIMHLEVVGSSDATFTQPKRNCRTEFVQCANCPFSEEVMSMPMAVSLLLELIRNNVLNEVIAEDLENPTSSLNLEFLGEKNIANQIPSKNSSGKEVHPALYLDCHASCCLKKSRVSDDESGSLFSPTLCDVTDAISLVELLACYMSWNWTFVNIISQLLELWKSSVMESLPILILLGQLGRFGVAVGGFEDAGVNILRSKLSAFLCLDTTIKSGLYVQISIVSALLGLLPFDFETIVQDKVSYSASSSQYVEVDLIKTWFSLLSSKQKELSCNILQVAVCNVS